MRKSSLVIVIILICATSGLAQSLNGIRVDCSYPVTVFINRTQMSPAVQSCFISSLRRGNYLVEAFVDDPRSHYGRRASKPIFSRNVQYPGNGIVFVTIDEIRHDTPNIPPLPSYGMEPNAFRELEKLVNEANFDSNRIRLLKSLVDDLILRAEQIKTLVEIIDFDNSREEALLVLYPCCVDKENFFTTLQVLKFNDARDRVMRNIKKTYRR